MALHTLLPIFVMALITYLIRMLPLVLFKKEIRNVFVRSFLYYVPYVCLAAMTFPAILTATGDVRVGAVVFVCALGAAYLRMPLLVVALLASAVAFAGTMFV